MLTLLVLWLVLYPVGWLIWGAFHSGPPGAAHAWTLENFNEVLLDPNHWVVVWRSILVGIGVTVLATVIGAPLAWLTVKTDLRGKRWVELSAIVPFFTSTFIGALAWILLGNPTNGVLRLWFGIPINVYSVEGIIWVTALYMAPYMYLFTAAALRNMDTTFEEASFMSGAGLWRTLTRVTFPLILPALLSAMTLVFVISMGIFGVAAILGFPARINLLATDIYVKALLIPPRFGAATVSALTLVVITAALIMLQRWALRSGSYALVSGRGFRIKLYALGKWTQVAHAWCFLYALLAVILPAFVLIKVSLQPYPTPKFGPWTLENYALFFNNDQLYGTLLRSLYLSTGGATLCVLLTAMIALHHRTDLGHALDRDRRLRDAVHALRCPCPGSEHRADPPRARGIEPGARRLMVPHFAAGDAAAAAAGHLLDLDPVVYHLHPRDQRRRAADDDQHALVSGADLRAMERRGFQHHVRRRVAADRHHVRGHHAVQMGLQGGRHAVVPVSGGSVVVVDHSRP
ncbi:MAG: iron ABC transporter permease [Betaproteobacteria bacterium]|nr:iron ABC transporter permease [Betaproteobacteria bacterium]